MSNDKKPVIKAQKPVVNASFSQIIKLAVSKKVTEANIAKKKK